MTPYAQDLEIVYRVIFTISVFVVDVQHLALSGEAASVAAFSEKTKSSSAIRKITVVVSWMYSLITSDALCGFLALAAAKN